jgi:hypothetical protein
MVGTPTWKQPTWMQQLPSIIEQIQRDALDNTVPVSTLLRRAKLAAAKLGLGAVEDWVEQELNGYTSNVPDYRVLQGRPMALNPYTGWHPIGGSVEVLSKRGIGQSVASIESMVASGKNGSLHLRYSDRICEKLDKANGVAGWCYALEVPVNQLAGILDRVRNLVLDWAIQMETAGVHGSDFAFNASEKQKAREVGMTINIGSIGSFSGNLGTGNVAGDIKAGDVNFSQVQSLLGQLKQHLGELEQAGADRSRLEQRVGALEAELQKASPDHSMVRGALTDIRNTLSGAAGSLIASGALNVLNQMLGTGIPSP